MLGLASSDFVGVGSGESGKLRILESSATMISAGAVTVLLRMRLCCVGEGVSGSPMLARAPENAEDAEVRIASEIGLGLVGVDGGDDVKSSDKERVPGRGVDCVEIDLSPRAGLFVAVEGVEEESSSWVNDSSVPRFFFFLDLPMRND